MGYVLPVFRWKYVNNQTNTKEKDMKRIIVLLALVVALVMALSFAALAKPSVGTNPYKLLTATGSDSDQALMSTWIKGNGAESDQAFWKRIQDLFKPENIDQPAMTLGKRQIRDDSITGNAIMKSDQGLTLSSTGYYYLMTPANQHGQVLKKAAAISGNETKRLTNIGSGQFL